MKISLLGKISTFLLLLLFSCDNSSEDTSQIYRGGIFVVNEGPFTGGTGSISFIDPQSKNVVNSIFSKTNDRPLGNIAQSINFFNGYGYIVVNNANKVEVVEEGTFRSVTTIEELMLPRNILGITQKKAYVSCWGEQSQGEIKVINLENHTIIKTISVATGPGAMVKVGNRVYVVNGGGFGSDNKISVIDITIDEVIDTIEVDDNPNSIVVDDSGRLWITCGGRKKYDQNTYEIIPEESTYGSLLQMDADTYEIIKRLNFNSIYDSPGNLITNEPGNTLFYLLGNGVYKFSVNDSNLPSSPLIGATFYGLGFDEYSGYLYGADAGDYTSAGTVLSYRSTDGVAVDTFRVGIIPNSFYFDN